MTIYIEKHDNILPTGDFNIAPENYHLKNFTDSIDFETLTREPIVLKELFQPLLTSAWQIEMAV